MTNRPDDTQARRLLRRIVICFAIIVLTLPLVMFGGKWAWLLLADIAVAGFALRSALQLRQLTRSE